MLDKVILSEFLNEGNIIKTKHYNSNNWVSNLIFSFDRDSIEIDIGLEKDYIENIIMIGDTMQCKYTTDDFEYTLLGWVNKIKLDNPQSITIKVHDVDRFSNKRKSYRYDVYLCSVIKKKKDDEKGLFGIVVNVSIDGVAFIAKEYLKEQIDKNGLLQEQEKYFFELYTTSKDKICFEGVIKRQKPSDKGNKYGVEITHIDISDKRMYSKFIDQLEEKDKEFYNKKNSFWSKHTKYNK
ncbi:PilZ domain-containing protein [Herbivorax sp. ANBcel31]|uniref:PilZ domain-containing protein n=1 Tax=Herbivorax sp. ANBcel31 TaxID=3069754 RepID=UPI0027AE21C9|nr:PilZ domain-containing protein [Herbivorax sp. ANBcel31]MDQ2086799.1 PilZ domain-containing protein [Herbivorax sp. ANBcel31]